MDSDLRSARPRSPLTRRPLGTEDKAVSKKSERRRAVGWLSLFVILPEGAWLTASLRSGFRGKSVSNLSLEPLLVAFSGIAVFMVWFLMARRGLRPLAGFILLILLAAAALAIQRFVPGLRE
jgi:hypothetical protein